MSPPPRVPGVHLITCEYPPQIGGVSDFCRAAARRLTAAGARVTIWAPGPAETAGDEVDGIRVERIAGGFGPGGLRELDRRLTSSDPGPGRQLFFQWVPHGYGFHGLNAAVCAWLLWRARGRGDVLELIVHEPGVGFTGSLKQWVVAVAHRVMLSALLAAAARVWLSTPAWERRVRPYLFGRRVPVRWLPLAMDVPVAEDPAGVATLRVETSVATRPVVGHFGTYGRSVTALLTPALETLLARRADLRCLLLGRGSTRYAEAFLAGRPELAGRVRALGEVDEHRLSLAVQACDLLLQPYPDGITTRRTSALVGLAHGRATVTTTGHLCEEAFWRETAAVRLVPPSPPDALPTAVGELLDDPAAREGLGIRGLACYRQHFAACDYGALLLGKGVVPDAPYEPA